MLKANFLVLVLVLQPVALALAVGTQGLGLGLAVHGLVIVSCSLANITGFYPFCFVVSVVCTVNNVLG